MYLDSVGSRLRGEFFKCRLIVHSFYILISMVFMQYEQFEEEILNLSLVLGSFRFYLIIEHT